MYLEMGSYTSRPISEYTMSVLSSSIKILFFDHNLSTVFRTDAIILYKQKIRDTQTRVVLFTYDFGKITVWYKKSVCPDIGTIIEAHIERKWSINHLISYDTSGFWEQESPCYEETIHILHIFHTLYDTLPDGVSHTHIFEDLRYLLTHFASLGHRYQSLLLFHSRILKQLGYMKESLFSLDTITRYVYKNIDTSSMKSITSSMKLEITHIECLQIAILEAKNTYA